MNDESRTGLENAEPMATGQVIPRPGTMVPVALNGGHAVVLIVDDDSSVRSTLSRLLRAEGFEVIAEADGHGALESVRLLRPDVVLLDVRLPDLDGFEVCRRLKADPETRLTPVVLLTGLSDLDSRVLGLESGADDFLSKPPERAELLARVRSLLRVKRYTDELVRSESVLLSLARSIEGKDHSTEGHCERLSAMAGDLGRRLGLSEDEITALDRAGIVHDIGKIAVPDAILLKPSRLTPDEWAIMREHPVTGEHICSPIYSFRLVLPIIRHHHEKRDGSGYPDALSGEQIPITARVLQVVDVYDALTTKRPYKPALSPTEALKTMHIEVEKGWWDPKLVAEFERLMLDGRDKHRGKGPRIQLDKTVAEV
jgi:putative two-component system response regulator